MQRVARRSIYQDEKDFRCNKISLQKIGAAVGIRLFFTKRRDFVAVFMQPKHRGPTYSLQLF